MSLVEFLPDHQEKKPGLMIIDYSQIALSTIFATFNPKELYDEHSLKTCILNTIRANVKKFKAKYPDIVIAVDGRNYWRRDIASYYKGHRAKGREDSPWDFDLIYGAMNSLLEDIANNFPYKVMNIDRCEADDIAGVLCKYHHSNYENILVVSSDGDWLQLQRFKNVKQYSTMHGKLITPKHGSAINDLLYKVIKGDKKDAVANIKSPRDAVITGTRQSPIGEKLCESWMHKRPEEFCTGDMLARYNENMSLLDLTAVPAEYENIILAEFVIPPKNSRAKIYPYLLKGGFKHLVDKVNEF